MDPRRPVQLTAPAERSSVRLARLVAAGGGAEAGLSIDDTEDLRIAVSELVALLVEGADDPRQSIVVTYRARPGEVTVDGERESVTARDERAGAAVDDLELEQRFREFQATGERAVRNDLVEAHRGLAARIANDYRGRGVELDDLVQIAMLGILKAVERFDPDRGIPFSSFASRTVNGEIKRYFRDRTWAVRPPRSTQERHLDLRRANAALSTRLGRPPTVGELAAELDIAEDDVLDAMEAGAAYRATSLDAR